MSLLLLTVVVPQYILCSNNITFAKLSISVYIFMKCRHFNFSTYKHKIPVKLLSCQSLTDRKLFFSF